MDEKLRVISEFCKNSGHKFKVQCTVYDDGEIFAEGGLYFEEMSPCYEKGGSLDDVIENTIQFIDTF